VIYDAEHWFDGYKHNPSYALETLKVAEKAGAKWLVFCDTNGGTLPHEITQIIKDVLWRLKIDPTDTKAIQLGIHTHDDAGTAVANALAAVREGVRMVQGTINGYGERCGNANLCTLIPNLQLKMGYNCLDTQEINQLTETSRLISEIVNLAPDDHAPFVGRSAFSPKTSANVAPRSGLFVPDWQHKAPKRLGSVVRYRLRR
jgi:2-isopropylmalate synthase